MNNWYDKYLPPLIERDKVSFKKIWRFFKDFWILFVHSISPHQFPKGPKEELPNIQSKNSSDVYSICKDIYDSANGRIDKLEDKAIKLLSYVTALFALISFAFLNIASITIKYVLLGSMILLLLAIIISFRCVNIKDRKSIFVADIFDFSHEKPRETFEVNLFSKKLLTAAIFNQNVADNTADILKSARNMLIVAIMLSAVALILGTFAYQNQPKPTMVKIETPIPLNDLENKLAETNNILKTINDNLTQANQERNTQVKRLSEQLVRLETNYDHLLKRIND